MKFVRLIRVLAIVLFTVGATSPLLSASFSDDVDQEANRKADSPNTGGKRNPTSVQIGLNAPESVVNGTGSQVNFGGAFRFLVRPPDICTEPSWATSLLLSGNHTRTYAVGLPTITEDEFDGTLSVSNRISGARATAVSFIGDVRGNRSLGLALEQSYGASFSRMLLTAGCDSTKRHNYFLTLSGDVGMRYVRERFDAPAQPANLAGARVGSNLTYISFGTNKNGSRRERFAVDMLVWAMPAVNNVHETQAGGSAGFSFPLAKSLTLTLTEEDDYFSHTPHPFRKNYSRSAVKLTFSFPAGTIVR